MSDTKKRQPWWKVSPQYESRRKVQQIGAFRRWKEANPEEHERVERRFKERQET